MKTNSTRGRSECWHVSVTVHSLDSQRVKVSKRQANVSVCSRFIGLVIRALRPLILFPVIAFADPVSNHNEPHAGIQSAIDRLDAAGCTRYSITRSGQYVLNSTADQDAFNLVGNTITIRCMAKVQPVAISHYLTWQHANRRTDGTAMQLSEVAGYELEHNGIVSAVGLVTEYTVNNPDVGSNRYRIATRDSLGQLGPFSGYVTLQ